MKLTLSLLVVLAWAVLAFPVSAQTTPMVPTTSGHNVWISAYYLAGDQDNGRLSPQKIDFSAFSHLIHFGIFPKSDGTIDMKSGITPGQSKTVIALAHTAGRKVLVCLGSNQYMRHVFTDSLRPTLVQSVVQFVVSRGYDGVDIDFEPLEDVDVVSYEKFIYELRASLIAVQPGLLLTAAVASEPEMFGRLQLQFDQINLMTYDLSGPWSGFKSWYNAGLYDGGSQKMTKTEPYPSVDGMVQQFVAAGVPKAKLGIGAAFYGYVWSGVSGPQQPIKGVSVNDSVDYNVIMDKYYQPDRYHWDAQAHAPYLSIDSPDPKQRTFVSYDDERLDAEKVTYAQQTGLGGLIIWELGADYRPAQPVGQQDVLLQAIKRAWKP